MEKKRFSTCCLDNFGDNTKQTMCRKRKQKESKKKAEIQMEKKEY